MLTNFCLENFVNYKLLSTKHHFWLIQLSLLFWMSAVSLCDSSTFPLWLLNFIDHFRSFITTARMKRIALLVTLSIRQYYYLSSPCTTEFHRRSGNKMVPILKPHFTSKKLERVLTMGHFIYRSAYSDFYGS